MLAKLFGRNNSLATKGAKLWKQFEKKGKEAESKNRLTEAKQFYTNALEEIQKLQEVDNRRSRYFSFKISQIRFALERVESQLHL